MENEKKVKKKPGRKPSKIVVAQVHVEVPATVKQAAYEASVIMKEKLTDVVRRGLTNYACRVLGKKKEEIDPPMEGEVRKIL